MRPPSLSGRLPPSVAHTRFICAHPAAHPYGPMAFIIAIASAAFVPPTGRVLRSAVATCAKTSQVGDCSHSPGQHTNFSATCPGCHNSKLGCATVSHPRVCPSCVHLTRACNVRTFLRIFVSPRSRYGTSDLHGCAVCRV